MRARCQWDEPVDRAAHHALSSVKSQCDGHCSGGAASLTAVGLWSRNERQRTEAWSAESRWQAKPASRSRVSTLGRPCHAYAQKAPDRGRTRSTKSRPTARTTVDRERPANRLDVFAAERRESVERKYLGFAPRLVGGRPVPRTRLLPERYASASDRYGGAALVPRKAKHVRFLQRSAFF